jgi:hypothetical protein
MPRAQGNQVSRCQFVGRLSRRDAQHARRSPFTARGYRIWLEPQLKLFPPHGCAPVYEGRGERAPPILAASVRACSSRQCQGLLHHALWDLRKGVSDGHEAARPRVMGAMTGAASTWAS